MIIMMDDFVIDKIVQAIGKDTQKAKETIKYLNDQMKLALITKEDMVSIVAILMANGTITNEYLKEIL